MHSKALELTERAEATHFWFHGFRAFVVPVLTELASGRPGLRLIDCGCGTGYNLEILGRCGRAYGFDVTAGEFRVPAGNAGRIVRADITRIPFASSSIDIATSFDVMQCIDGDAEAMREIARVLRPGGAAVVTMAALEMLRGDHSISWREARRYTPSSARQLVERAGLQVERVTFMFASLFPLILATRVGQRLLRPYRAHRDDTDIAVPSGPVNAILAAVVRGEAALARRVPMPFGSSLMVVARKP